MTTLEPHGNLVKAGREVATRQDDDLEIRHRGWLVSRQGEPRQVVELVTRARQATARQLVWVVDQPLVSKGVAVGRQLPKAGGLLVVGTPRGGARLATMLADWLRDAQSAELLAKHADAGEGESWTKVSAERRATNLPRRRALVGMVAGLLVLMGLAWWAPHIFAGILAVATFAGTIAMAPRSDLKEWGYGAGVATLLGGLAWWQGPGLAAQIPQPPAWVWWSLGGVLVAVFAWFGRHPDQPLLEKTVTVVAHKAPPITAPMVMAALVALGNSKMKFVEDIRLLMDPHRDGPGVRVEMELPPGVTSSFVMEKREEFAAALRRELGTVWPSVGPRHPGHLVVVISDQVMAEAEQEPWPLLNGGEVDMFRPVPLFTNQQGSWIYLVLAYSSVIIGAVPRMGKTFTLRELLLVAGLDRRTKVIALDGKGTGDLAPIGIFAHRYVRGVRTDDLTNIEKVRDIVRELLAELGRRADVIASLPEDECPESKVTSELINNRPDLELGQYVVGIDETQSFFSFGNKTNKEHRAIREEIREGFIELQKLGPAVGIWIYFATQQVRESTIPTDVASNAVIRYALKLEGHEPNDRILGTGAYRRGIDAQMFDFSDKGIGILKAEGMRAEIARSVFGLDAPASRKVAERCRQMRVQDGTLTGDAGDDGIEDAEIVYDLVEDAERAMRAAGCGKAQWAELVNLLRELRPGQYGALTEQEVSAGIRAAGIDPRDIRSGATVRKGVYISDLRKRGVDDAA